MNLASWSLFGLVAIPLTLGACKRDTDTDTNPTPDPEPTAEQVAAADDGSDGADAVQAYLGFTDQLFNYDPDLDATGTAQGNADKIRSNVEAGATCVTVTSPAQGTVDFDFGAGCTFGAYEVSGALSVVVAIDNTDPNARKITVGLEMTALTINGLTIDGAASFTTSNGFKLDVVLDLETATKRVATQLTVTGAAGSFTIDGTATREEGSDTIALTYDGVKVEKAACWPSDGTVQVDTGAVSETLAFDADTATTGQATLTFAAGNKDVSTCYALPDHGECVATPCP
ncbi:MAG: hypothetical protein U0271_24265 [Polyangiaceae bacterium]